MKLHRMLVVDDESGQRRLFRRLFERHGLEVESAASGAEALEILEGNAPFPHVILCDIAMPGMDGVAFLRFLRSNPATASIPTILMSGLTLPPGLMAIAVEALGIGPLHIKGDPIAGLLTRVRAKLKSPARARGVVIDPLKRTIWIDDRKLPRLPARRFQLLCALLRKPHMVSRDELLDQVWDENDNINNVDVTVLRLRQDLRDFPLLRIEPAPAGYRLVIDDRPGLSRPN
jgi:DNA-binding response OmpR family regulator